MSHIQVQLQHTSIFFAQTDVIVCPVDPDLDLSKYHLSRELSEKVPTLQERLLRQRPNGARYYEYVHVSVEKEKLHFKEIIFLVCAPCIGIYSEQKLLDAFKRLLLAGEDIRAESIAFPAIGCGKLKYSLKTVIVQLLRAADLHSTSQSSSLRKVFFATPNADDAQEFEEIIKSLYGEAKPQRTKSVNSKSPSKTTSDAYVYYLNEKQSKSFAVKENKNYPTSDNCLHLLFEKLTSRSKKTNIEKKLVPLKKKDVVKNDIWDVSEDSLTALFDSAHDATATICITTEQKDPERLREFAVVVVKAFNFLCDNGGNVTEVVVHIAGNLLETFCTAVLEAFFPIAPPSLSLPLETFQPQKRVTSHTSACRTTSQGSISDQIGCEDTLKSQFDNVAHWDAQGQHATPTVSISHECINNDERQTAIQARLKQVQATDDPKVDESDTWKLSSDCKITLLNSESTEYRQIESEFMHTAGASAGTVVKIERIQDPCMWRQFKILEQKVMKNLGSSKYPVSRRLWHGTSAAVVSNMVTSSDYRFNRSYARDQGLYGKGCYFATDASYAAQPQYALRNADGTGHVFLTQVLTGRYMKGSPDMQPFPKRPGTEGLFFDSTVDDELDPSIFVTYHDTQAYPLYLVTFL